MIIGSIVESFAQIVFIKIIDSRLLESNKYRRSLEFRLIMILYARSASILKSVSSIL
jgi:hypothetical protein